MTITMKWVTLATFLIVFMSMSFGTCMAFLDKCKTRNDTQNTFVAKCIEDSFYCRYVRK